MIKINGIYSWYNNIYIIMGYKKNNNYNLQ